VVKKEAVPADRPEPGLHLVLNDLGQVVRSAEIRNAPRRFLQPPFLTPRTLKLITVPMSELVLDLLGPDGRRLDHFGWPWTAEAFYDRSLREVVQGLVAYGTLRVGRLESRQPLRALRVPVPKSTAFLLFSRTIASQESGKKTLTLSRMGLALYSRVSPIPPVPRLPITGANLSPEPLPGPKPLAQPR
jgi:hypothetical protein